VVGVFLLADSVQGYLIKKAIFWEKVVLFVAALLLIKLAILTDLLGIGGALLILGSQFMRGRSSAGLERK